MHRVAEVGQGCRFNLWESGVPEESKHHHHESEPEERAREQHTSKSDTSKQTGEPDDPHTAAAVIRDPTPDVGCNDLRGDENGD